MGARLLAIVVSGLVISLAACAGGSADSVQDSKLVPLGSSSASVAVPLNVAVPGTKSWPCRDPQPSTSGVIVPPQWSAGSYTAEGAEVADPSHFKLPPCARGSNTPPRIALGPGSWLITFTVPNGCWLGTPLRGVAAAKVTADHCVRVTVSSVCPRPSPTTTSTLPIT
jgi:hypothetical protein